MQAFPEFHIPILGLGAWGLLLLPLRSRMPLMPLPLMVVLEVELLPVIRLVSRVASAGLQVAAGSWKHWVWP